MTQRDKLHLVAQIAADKYISEAFSRIFRVEKSELVQTIPVSTSSKLRWTRTDKDERANSNAAECIFFFLFSRNFTYHRRLLEAPIYFDILHTRANNTILEFGFRTREDTLQ